MKDLIPAEIVERKIFLIRGQRVMLSPHLAEMYGVEVRAMIQAVKRNLKRFPADFMFQLDWPETENLKSQFVISSGMPSSKSQNVILKRGGNIKFRPYAFTEQGVAMLSSVLKSDRAIQVNIAIMRIFVRLREMLLANKELAGKLKLLENKIEKHDTEIQAIFEAIHQLMNQPEDPKKKIGFIP